MRALVILSLVGLAATAIQPASRSPTRTSTTAAKQKIASLRARAAAPGQIPVVIAVLPAAGVLHGATVLHGRPTGVHGSFVANYSILGNWSAKTHHVGSGQQVVGGVQQVSSTPSSQTPTTLTDHRSIDGGIKQVSQTGKELTPSTHLVDGASGVGHLGVGLGTGHLGVGIGIGVGQLGVGIGVGQTGGSYQQVSNGGLMAGASGVGQLGGSPLGIGQTGSSFQQVNKTVSAIGGGLPQQSTTARSLPPGPGGGLQQIGKTEVGLITSSQTQPGPTAIGGTAGILQQTSKTGEGSVASGQPQVGPPGIGQTGGSFQQVSNGGLVAGASGVGQLGGSPLGIGQPGSSFQQVNKTVSAIGGGQPSGIGQTGGSLIINTKEGFIAGGQSTYGPPKSEKAGGSSLLYSEGFTGGVQPGSGQTGGSILQITKTEGAAIGSNKAAPITTGSSQLGSVGSLQQINKTEAGLLASSKSKSGPSKIGQTGGSFQQVSKAETERSINGSSQPQASSTARTVEPGQGISLQQINKTEAGGNFQQISSTKEGFITGTQPGEEQPGGSPPEGGQPGDSPPGEEQPGGSPPEGGQPGDSPPGEEQPGRSPPGEEQPEGSPPEGEQPGDSPPGEGQPGGSPPGDGEPGDSPPEDGQPGGSYQQINKTEGGFAVSGQSMFTLSGQRIPNITMDALDLGSLVVMVSMQRNLLLPNNDGHIVNSLSYKNLPEASSKLGQLFVSRVVGVARRALAGPEKSSKVPLPPSGRLLQSWDTASTVLLATQGDMNGVRSRKPNASALNVLGAFASMSHVFPDEGSMLMTLNCDQLAEVLTSATLGLEKASKGPPVNSTANLSDFLLTVLGVQLPAGTALAMRTAVTALALTLYECVADKGALPASKDKVEMVNRILVQKYHSPHTISLQPKSTTNAKLLANFLKKVPETASARVIYAASTPSPTSPNTATIHNRKMKDWRAMNLCTDLVLRMAGVQKPPPPPTSRAKKHKHWFGKKS